MPSGLESSSSHRQKNVSKTFKVSRRKAGVIGAAANFFVPKFEKKEAVKNISFSIEKGEAVGFIGPNGKSHTVVSFLV